MKLHTNDLSKLLKEEDDAEIYTDDIIEVGNRIEKMRTNEVKNKKQDNSVYKNHDTKRYKR